MRRNAHKRLPPYASLRGLLEGVAAIMRIRAEDKGLSFTQVYLLELPLTMNGKPWGSGLAFCSAVLFAKSKT